MAKGQSSDRPETHVQQQQGQGRSVARREDYFPNFGGDLFSLSPFALMREMSDWMDRSWGGSLGTASRGGAARGGRMWSPAVEVRQKDNNLVVCADLPGIDQNDVKVEIENDTLIIQGERKQEQTDERAGWHRTERSYGSFYRAIPLPEGAKTDQAKADFRNGVLEVRVPVEEPKANRRQIQIQGGSSSAAGPGSSTSSESGGSNNATPSSGSHTSTPSSGSNQTPQK